MLTCFGFLDCFYTIGGQLISGIDIEADGLLFRVYSLGVSG
jgi:hypothetical protein